MSCVKFTPYLTVYSDQAGFTPSTSVEWDSNTLTFQLGVDMSSIAEGTAVQVILATVSSGDYTYTTTTNLYKRGKADNKII